MGQLDKVPMNSLAKADVFFIPPTSGVAFTYFGLHSSRLAKEQAFKIKVTLLFAKPLANCRCMNGSAPRFRQDLCEGHSHRQLTADICGQCRRHEHANLVPILHVCRIVRQHSSRGSIDHAAGTTCCSIFAEGKPFTMSLTIFRVISVNQRSLGSTWTQKAGGLTLGRLQHSAGTSSKDCNVV
ncbi:hypothetical protein VFPPC_17376 [Pochonia chlamydosporia 170]|uniref:Uncharacterized protein n=1 Tax=Pochonia chlamydosporia 170 TaxID=1380566 RepID=A0A219ATF9_METCM|nr:hypothetical protein VFPPC_17376 [Pochonia chlamydosporia 170]OWT43475.1 hypothetical protein VFPPC_17376 [Pochonia chlamydosporia 170]